MIFSELYSAYYNTVAAIIRAAIDHPVDDKEMTDIVGSCAFEESMLTIPDAIREGKWQLMNSDGTTSIRNIPSMPLTTIEKRWLKAISLDPRIKLFENLEFGTLDVEPLFEPEDIVVFDRYNDGDNYEKPSYIKNFRLIMDAIVNKYPIDIKMRTSRGKYINLTMLPEHLEYSEKDDKFRVNGKGSRYGDTVNLSRIIRCERCDMDTASLHEARRSEQRLLVFDLVNERNGLERILLHFAHFKKEVERLEDDKYRVHLYYEKEDETEIVIRILSFGPMIKVIEPDGFVNLIKDRLVRQKSCEL